MVSHQGGQLDKTSLLRWPLCKHPVDQNPPINVKIQKSEKKKIEDVIVYGYLKHRFLSLDNFITAKKNIHGQRNEKIRCNNASYLGSSLWIMLIHIIYIPLKDTWICPALLISSKQARVKSFLKAWADNMVQAWNALLEEIFYLK